MPRIDAGSYVIDIHVVSKLEPGRAVELAEWAISNRVLAVTEPSIVAAKPAGGSAPSTLISLGIGSLITTVKPPIEDYYITVRSEWVSGCEAGSREPNVNKISGREVDVEGVIISISIDDPVAMLISGVKGVHKVVVSSREEGLPLSLINGKILVLARLNNKYILTLRGGPALNLAEYGTLLFSTCT